jgi:hypothetical protein
MIARVPYKYKKTDFLRWIFPAFFLARRWIETITRAIVLHIPINSLVLWDKTMLKDLIGGAFVGGI